MADTYRTDASDLVKLKIMKEDLERATSAHKNCERSLQMRDMQLKVQIERQQEMEKIHGALTNEYEKQVNSLKQEIKCLKHGQEKLLKKFNIMQRKNETVLNHEDEERTSTLTPTLSLGKCPQTKSAKLNESLNPTEVSSDNLDKVMTLFCYGIEEEVHELSRKTEHSSPAFADLINNIDKGVATAHEFVSHLQKIKENLLKRKDPNFGEAKISASSHSFAEDDEETEAQRAVTDAWNKINWEQVLIPDEAKEEIFQNDDSLDKFKNKLNDHFHKLDSLMNCLVQRKLACVSELDDK